MTSGASHSNVDFHVIILFLTQVKNPTCHGAFVQAARYFDPLDFRTPDNVDAQPTDWK